MGEEITTTRLVLGLFITVVYCCAATEERVSLDDSWPPDTRANFQAATNDVWSIVQDLLNNRHPPVDLPIKCHFGIGVPITQLDNLLNPKTILISLAVSNYGYDQFVFQLAHEFGHVMLGPRRSDGLLRPFAMHWHMK
jgi:hypothetical protein